MRSAYSSVILWILVGILASVPRAACSQFGEEARASKKIESQLLYKSEGYPPSYSSGIRDYSGNCNVAFSPDGTFVLVHDFAAHKVLRIDTLTLQQTLVSESLRHRYVRMHHLTGEIFVWNFGETVTDAKLAEIFADDSSKYIAHSKANDVTAIEKRKLVLTNYRNVDDFKADKPAWSILDELDIWRMATHGSANVIGGNKSSHHTNNLCWLPNVELYAVVQGLGYERRYEEEVLFIDRKGRIAGRFQFGRIMGIDIGESGIEIYHMTGKRKPYFAQRSTIDNNLERIEKTEKLYRMASEWHDCQPFLTYGSKLLRYTDPKPGDVRKFFAEVMNDPRFWSYEDYPNLADDFQQKLPEFMPSDFIRFTSIPNRSGSFGILASREDPSIPEVSPFYSDSLIDSRRWYDLRIVLDHRGNLLPLPVRMWVVDAFCNQEQMMLIGESSNDHSDQEFQLIKVVAADPENPNAEEPKR